MFEFRVKRSLTFWSRRRASSCGNIDEAVQDGHSLVGDTSIGVNLLEDLIYVMGEAESRAYNIPEQETMRR